MAEYRKRLTPRQRIKRDTAIATDRLQGEMSWKELSRKYDLTTRQCRRLVRQWLLTEGPMMEQDPVVIVDDLLRGFLADMWEFNEAADQAWERNQITNVINAVRSRMDARAKALELLQATGRLPRDLGRLRVEIDMRFMVEQIVEVLDEFNVPDEARLALVERLEQPQLQAAAGE